MLAIRLTTINLLKQFKASGGVILVLGKYPDYVNGEPGTEAIDTLKKISRLVSENEFVEAEKRVSTELKQAIQQAKSNIEKFHKAQIEEPKIIETTGIRTSFVFMAHPVVLEFMGGSAGSSGCP